MSTILLSAAPKATAPSDAGTAPARTGPPALFALMRRQYGVASRAQARAAGVSRAVERRLVAEGSLVRPLEGILAVGGIWPSFGARCMAASMLAGVGAVSHGAAARLHGLTGYRDHEELDVLGQRGARLRHPLPVIAHRSRHPFDAHVVRAGPVPVTSIPLTLVLLSGESNERNVALALDDALRRGVPSAEIMRVAREWRCSGRRGPAHLLRALSSGS